MRLRKFLPTVAPVLLLFAIAPSSFAGIAANGSFGFTILGCCNLDGGPTGTGDLLGGTNIDWQNTANGVIVTNDATTFGNPNDFQSLFLTTAVLQPSGFATTFGLNPMTLTFGPSGIYSFVASSQSLTVNTLTRSISLYFLGTFADSTSFYDSGAASLTLSFSQSAPDSSVSGSGTFSTPPAPNSQAPEPATMGVMGVALIGLGVLGRNQFTRR